MRVLHVDLHPGWSGGQAQLLHLAVGQREGGDEPWIATPAGGPLASRAEGVGLPVLPFAAGGDVDPRGPAGLARLLGRLRPVAVHAHGPHELAHAALAARLAGPRRRPAVLAHRRVDFPLRRHALSRWKWRRGPDRVIAVSRWSAEVLASAGVPRERIAVVHDGVPPPGPLGPGPSLRERIGAEPGAPLVVTVGGVEPRKDPWTILAAAGRLAGPFPEARWVVLGDGPLLEAVRDEAERRGLADRFRLLGFVPDAAARVAEADVLAHAPRAEALGVAVLEAMAAGRPVVASRVGGLSEVVAHGRTGLLVPSGNPAALAAAVARLLADPRLADSMGRAARARAREFSVDRMVEGVRRAYAAALA